jgi:hypothetical protein
MPARRGERVLPNRRDEVNDVIVPMSTKHTNLMENSDPFLSYSLSHAIHIYIIHICIINTHRERESEREKTTRF